MVLEEILHDLNSGKEALHTSALQQARSLPPEELLTLAQMEAQNYRRHVRRVNAFWLSLIALLSIFLIAHYGFGVGRFRFPIFEIYSLYWLCYALQYAVSRYLPTQARQSIARILAETQDMRFLGVGLSLLQDNKSDPAVTKSVLIAIRRLLPQIRNDQRDQLTQEQKKAFLHLLISPYEDVPLTLAVLKALEQVGDEGAMPVVERLAAEPPATPKMKQVRQAACACLEHLHLHAQESHQAQTLLRASAASSSETSGVLLRPAENTGDTVPPEQLLRSSTQELDK